MTNEFRPAVAATTAKSSIEGTAGYTSYTVTFPDLQQDFAIALKGLKAGNFRFVGSSKCWFRWTTDGAWRPVNFTEVYDIITGLLVDGNRHPPRWLLWHIEAESWRNPDTSTDGYLGIQNPPTLSQFSPFCRIHIARGYCDDRN